MTQYRIQKVGVKSMAKLHAVILGLFALIMGLIYALVFGILLGAQYGKGVGLAAAAGTIILIPLIYGAVAYLAGALIAWFYNIAAGRVGGLEIELSETPNSPASSVSPPVRPDPTIN